MPLPLIALQGKLPTRLAEPQLSPVAVGETLEFGRFKVLLRRRELLSEAVPIELGARAFDLLLILLEADGALVTKEELLSRAWLVEMLAATEGEPLSKLKGRLPPVFEKCLGVEVSENLDQRRYHPGPTGLMS